MKVLTFIFAFFTLIGVNVADWIQDLDQFCYLKNCQYYESSAEAADLYLDSFELKDIEASKPSGYLVKFEFFAFAPTNVHVSFAPKPYPKCHPDHQFYEIVINYEHTHIRRRAINNLGDITITNTPKVLNPYLPNHILVKIRDDGRITVHVNNKTVAAAVDSSPLKVEYFSFASYQSTRVQYYYDCKNRSADVVQNNLSVNTQHTEKTETTKNSNTVLNLSLDELKIDRESTMDLNIGSI